MDVSNSLRAEALFPGLGVKVDIDLGREPGEAECEELNRLLMEHQLLFIETPGLTAEQQIAFTSIFGTVTQIPGTEVATLISNARADGYQGNRELFWHNDFATLMHPDRVAVLHAVDVQAGKSATRFLSAARAVERLPAALVEKLRYLQIINVAETDADAKLGHRVAIHGSDVYGAAHPVIAIHPVSGVPYLTPNGLLTDCVLGMNVEESQALLAEIFGYFHDEAHVYDHYWKNGDLVVWDNLAVHHARKDVSNVGARTLRRTGAGIARHEDQMPPRTHEARAEMLRQRRGTVSGLKERSPAG